MPSFQMEAYDALCSSERKKKKKGSVSSLPSPIPGGLIFQNRIITPFDDYHVKMSGVIHKNVYIARASVLGSCQFLTVSILEPAQLFSMLLIPFYLKYLFKIYKGGGLLHSCHFSGNL